MKQNFYICKHCGNTAAMLRDAGVPIMCCGEKMREIIPGTTEASGEKHIPVYEVDGNTVRVTVGAAEHPMTEEHYIEQFKSIGCEVYSVSTDTHFVHKAWHDASERIKKINYPMLADPTHAISKDFEVLIESDGLAERGTFIINPEGRIVGYEVTAGNVGRNAEELLRKVQACQFVHAHGDRVCPANWKPGAETLKPSLDLVGQL